MKSNKKLLAALLALVLIANFSVIALIPASAHESILDVTYDDCNATDGSDNIDETWYVLDNGMSYFHFPHNVDTITYRFEGDPADWVPDGISESMGEELKAAYAESMKKWNNVYFYSHNNDGTITKNKLINIVETTDETPNIIILPATEEDIDYEAAQTYPVQGEELETGTPKHEHITNWEMFVNVDAFFENTAFWDYLGQFTDDIDRDITYTWEVVGAHEFGHVLGLRDIDYYCSAYRDQNSHHQEVLMGYGNPAHERSFDITYKDIAGVAITRGFHTYNDHKWLNMGQQSDGTYKLVCSICNGVKTVSASELNEYSCSTYGACEGDHDNLLYGNMMAVASYGNQDYYKCRYCRYVAPFSEIVEQNYSKVCCSTDYHRCVNTVNGLAYEFYEPHTLVDGVCTECTSHDYNDCVYLNQLTHQRVCACGAMGGTERHYVTGGNGINRFVPCAGCGYMLDMRDDIHEGIMSITKVSVNGSYIRSDGIVVLVDQDIEAYLAGTLQFYHPANLPVTQ